MAKGPPFWIAGGETGRSFSSIEARREKKAALFGFLILLLRKFMAQRKADLWKAKLDRRKSSLIDMQNLGPLFI